MRRGLAPEGVEVHSPDLVFESEAQATEILRRSYHFNTPGVKTGLVVTVNATNGTRVNITAGDGYTGDPDLTLTEGTNIFEYVQLASAITGQTLADYGVGMNNYFCLVYTESTDTSVTRPQPHESDGRAYPTRAVPRTDAGILEVVDQTTWDSYYDTDLQRRLCFAIVTARGVGTNLSSTDIELPPSFSPAVYDMDVPRATAVDGWHRSMVGSGTPGLNNPHGLTLGDLGGEVAFVTVGDGVLSTGDYTGTDTAIQAAVDAIRTFSWKGGVIFIKKGDYSPSSTITLYSNVYLMGEGRTTKIRRPSGAHLFQTDGNAGSGNGGKTLGSPNFTDAGNPFTANMVGDYIWINQGDADDGSYEIIAFNNTGSVVLDRDMTVTQAATTYEVHKSKIVLENLYLDGLGRTGNFDLIYWNYTRECAVRWCWMKDNSRYGAHLIYCNNLLFSKNFVERNANRGLLFDHCNQNVIDGNVVQRNGDDGIDLEYCDLNTVSGNICNYNNVKGIDNYGGDKNTFSGNICCYNVTDDGIYMNVGAGSNCITGNVCNDNGDDGIGCHASAGGNTIVGNQCHDNTGNGIVAAASNNIIVMGNRCSGNAGGNYNVVAGNGCDACDGAHQWGVGGVVIATDFNQ